MNTYSDEDPLQMSIFTPYYVGSCFGALIWFTFSLRNLNYYDNFSRFSVKPLSFNGQGLLTGTLTGLPWQDNTDSLMAHTKKITHKIA